MRWNTWLLLGVAPLLLAPRCPASRPLEWHPPDSGVVDSGGGCGGEAAAGGYTKTGGSWDGSAGNPYGYPSGAGGDCAGFGFFSTKRCGFFESCDVACSADSDCPAVSGGPAPRCEQATAIDPHKCVMPCSGGDCPQGMQCVDDPYGYGQICLWPRSYAPPDAGN